MGEKFPGEPKAEQTKVPEYSFEVGLEQALERIRKVLKNKDIAVMAVWGSSTQVGKSTLAKQIIQELARQGVNAFSFMGMEDIAPNRMAGVMNQPHISPKKVVVMEQFQIGGGIDADMKVKYRKHMDEQISELFRHSGLEVAGVDLWVGIYSPDKPFISNNNIVADLIIRNKGAVK